MMIFIEIKSQLAGAPLTWGAAEWPYTFVITQPSPGQYVASARDSVLGGRDDLGANFPTLQAAQDACHAFVRSKQQ
jgi:hypothetical protein